MFYKTKKEGIHTKVGEYLEIKDENQLKYLVDNDLVEPEGSVLNPSIKTLGDLAEAVNNDDTVVASAEPMDTKKSAKDTAKTTTTSNVIA